MPLSKWQSLSFANMLSVVAILIFARGFFPYKHFIPGHADQVNRDGTRVESAPFNKVVFMVVDALRSDFVYGFDSAFTFTQSLVRAGVAVPFTAHATSPTITMPRIKAMTTGSIPSFLDVILNFAESDTSSSLADQDNWLFQLKTSSGGKVNMFGDDTWLKLFPETFSRTDGTTSFFVSDYTEVDNNVTRNLAQELVSKDWNGMVMHYLGLDHIGHKTGPKGPHMLPKQKEMDDVVRQIYGAIENMDHLQDTLLILCGDHGMNDAGNHGGSSESETSPVLAFISPKFQQIQKSTMCPTAPATGRFGYYKTVEQSDLAPTLAGLLGFPIPLNNLGVFMEDFLELFNDDVRLRMLHENVHQMLRILRGTFPHTDFDKRTKISCCGSAQSSAEELHCLFHASLESMPANDKIKALTKFCKRAQDVMTLTATNYDTASLIVGTILATISLCCLMSANSELINGSIAARFSTLYLVGLHGMMMFASSYIEEEQDFWYWATSCWFILIFIKSQASMSQTNHTRYVGAISLMITLRVLRRWNQTGQKYAGSADLVKDVLVPHSLSLWAFVLVTYLLILRRLSRTLIPWAPGPSSTIVAAALTAAALGFKIAFNSADAPELLSDFEAYLPSIIHNVSLVAQARYIFLGSSVFLMLTVIPAISADFCSYRRGEAANKDIRVSQRITQRPMGLLHPVHGLLMLCLVTQSRITNIPAFLLFETQYHALEGLGLSAAELSLTCILLQHTSYFALGGSNAISSIDLSNAYNGVGGYNVIAVGILTFLSNWAGPVWWTLTTAILQSSSHRYRPRRAIFVSHFSIMSLFATSRILFIVIACTILRTHLFIWTVFSPKYLYVMAWTIGQHITVDLAVGAAVTWLSSY